MRVGTKAVLGALSAAGVVGTHLVAYALTEQALPLRSPELFAAAHNHWNYVVSFALAASAWGLSRFLTERAREPGVGPARVGLTAFPSLAILQVAGFLILELLEISLAGGDVHFLLSQQPILLGLAVAVVLAAVGSMILSVLAATVDFVSRSVGKVPSEPISKLQMTFGSPPLAFKVDAKAWGLRGPPAPTR